MSSPAFGRRTGRAPDPVPSERPLESVVEPGPGLEPEKLRGLPRVGDPSPDVLIAATGYRHQLEPLVGHLGVLTETGRPITHGASTHPATPRLYFNGYWLPMSGQLPAMRRTTKAITRRIARERRREARAARSSAAHPRVRTADATLA